MPAKDMEQVNKDDLMAVLEAEGFSVAAVADVTLVKEFELTDKEDLIGRPFVIVQVLIKPSLEYGTDYVVCRCLDANKTRFVFADGSTGIGATIAELMTNYEQYRESIREDDPDDPDFSGGWKYNIAIPVLGGLTKNQYMTRVKNERTGVREPKMATTYRLKFDA